MGSVASSASNSFSSSSLSSQNGTVKAHRATSRMTKGTPIPAARAAHIENKRAQHEGDPQPGGEGRTHGEHARAEGPRGRVGAGEGQRLKVFRVGERVLL